MSFLMPRANQARLMRDEHDALSVNGKTNLEMNI